MVQAWGMHDMKLEIRIDGDAGDSSQNGEWSDDDGSFLPRDAQEHVASMDFTFQKSINVGSSP